MSKAIYLNKKNIERGPINNNIDINLIKFIEMNKMVVQAKIKDEIITKASIIEGLIKHAMTSKEESIQIDEIAYTYQDVPLLHEELKRLSDEFYKHCMTKTSDYICIKDQIYFYLNEDDNKIEDSRDISKYLIEDILSMLVNSFEGNNGNEDLINVMKVYKPDFENDIYNKIYLAVQYVYGSVYEGEDISVNKYLKEVAKKYSLELTELKENYMLKFIIQEFSTKEYEKNHVCFVDQIFEHSTLSDIGIKFQEELKKEFEKFITVEKQKEMSKSKI